MIHIRRRHRRRLLVALTTLAIGIISAPTGTASAHPLGNFSVSHLSTLRLEADRIVIDTIIDSAEIPTAQDRSAVDVDDDGTADADERARHAESQCALFADAATLRVDDATLTMTTVNAVFVYEDGQAGLSTSRLGCRFTAPVPADFATAEHTVTFSDTYRTGRVGWHEINAVGVDVGIVSSPIPPTSVTDGLRAYPDALLDSPLGVRDAALDIGPAGTTVTADVVASGDDLLTARPGPLGGVVDGVQARFDDLIGQRDLTVGVGMLAVGLSLVLGASHALLPGHGKTIMAAYIAGRQGTARDAVVVGATVTATHTGGVLLLGLGLSISTALAGETVLSWLGVASGALIAALGLAMLVSAVRRHDRGWLGHGHHHGPGGHTHHHPDRDHDDRGGHGHRHDHPHTHDRHHRHDHSDHTHDDRDAQVDRRVSRRGLVGMGVAGGLVPSPSALIVLLSAIALGRTWFGVFLVVGYGVGMAVVLTVAGVLLVGLRDRIHDRFGDSSGRTVSIARRWARLIPTFTALMVLVVGVGVAARSASVI